MLNDQAARSAASREKQYKLSDGDGMYLLIKPAGGKYWQMKYRFAGKEKTLSFGTYPEVSISEAREKRSAARKLLRDDKDPQAAKKETKIQQVNARSNSLESIAREWYENQLCAWVPAHAKNILKRLEIDIFPALGSKSINEITAPALLAVLRGIEARGAGDVAHRVLQTCGQVFRYAIATGRAERDISSDLRGALKVVKREHFASFQEKDLPGFLKKLEAYAGELQTKLALKLLVLTFVRTTELRGARWAEIDFNKKEWRIPAERMKMRQPHIVPLTDQSIAVLKELNKLSGCFDLVFPSRSKPVEFISDNTMLHAMYRMGYQGKGTPHGIRATASTILNENGFNSDVIERQLAHTERNKVRASYNHAQYLPDRKILMQWWADYVTKLQGVI